MRDIMKKQLFIALVGILSNAVANDPFDLFDQHMFERFEEMDKLFNQHMKELKEAFKQRAPVSSSVSSKISIKEQDDHATIVLTLGETVKQEEMTVEVDDQDLLTVTVKSETAHIRLICDGKKRVVRAYIQERNTPKKEDEKDSYHHMSVAEQYMTLAHAVDVKNAQPTFKNGVLTLVLPYKKAKKIEIAQS